MESYPPLLATYPDVGGTVHADSPRHLHCHSSVEHTPSPPQISVTSPRRGGIYTFIFPSPTRPPSALDDREERKVIGR